MMIKTLSSQKVEMKIVIAERITPKQVPEKIEHKFSQIKHEIIKITE